jgi:hypothetical protein
LGETGRDILEHKNVVNGNDIDIVDPLFFELLVGAYVARDLSTAGSGECARYANLQGVRFVLLLHSRTMPYEDVSALELSDVESLLWIVFFDRCIGGELAARLDLPVGHGCNVVRN